MKKMGRPVKFGNLTGISSIDYIITLRNKLKLSQCEFGKCVGVSPSCVADWEKGRRNPSKSALMLMKQLERDK